MKFPLIKTQIPSYNPHVKFVSCQWFLKTLSIREFSTIHKMRITARTQPYAVCKAHRKPHNHTVNVIKIPHASKSSAAVPYFTQL